MHTLLVQDMPNLALRALRAPGPPIGTVLEIKTLLANNLITEAFELQRTKYDENLLLEFYKGCHHLKKWNYVLGLALTEREGQVLLKFLRGNESLLSENLQLLYLLQRNKYIEALTHLDGLKHRQRPAALQRQLDNTQGTIFAAYKMGMVPSDRKLSDLFLSVKDHAVSKKAPLAANRGIKNEETKPFSSDLNTKHTDSNANIIGDLFQRAILSTKCTSASITANSDAGGDDGMQGYVPFLSKPSIDFDYFECNSTKAVTYPTSYIGATKRRKEIAFEDNGEPEYNQPAAKRQRTTDAGIDNDVSVMRYHPTGISDVNETVNLLSTPVVKRRLTTQCHNIREHSQTPADNYASGNQSSRCQTPQSILKHRHAESVASRRSVSPTLTINSARRSVDFDERSFRFGTMHPNMTNTSAEEYRLSAIPEAEHDQNSPFGTIKSRMVLHGTDTSVQSTSADEYFSPENTILSDRPYDIEEEQNADDEIQRDFEEMSDFSNDSVKADKEIESKPADVRDTRRSASRERTTLQPSTRITRSQSKLNVDADGVDDLPKQLDTSTPLRSIRGRTPLSKAVIEINASRLLAGRKKIIDETASTSMSQSRSAVDNESCGNVLDDNSDMNESMIQKYLGNKTMYSDASTAYSPNARSRRNILEDSSAYAQDIFDRPEETSASDERRKESETDADASEPMEVDELEEVGNEVITVGDTTEEKSNVDEQPSNEDKLGEKDAIDGSHFEESEQREESEGTGKCTDADESTAQIEPSTPNWATGSPVNVLTDNSIVSESFVRRFTRTNNSAVYSDTSTIFYSSTRATNVLEESSFGPTLARHSIDVADEPPIDLFQPQDSSDVEDDEEDREVDKNKYVSDVEELQCDSSGSRSSNDSSGDNTTNRTNGSNDSNDSNKSIESNNSTLSSTSSRTTSSSGTSARSNQDDNEIVINISSGSELSLPSNRDEMGKRVDAEMPEENFANVAMRFAQPDPPIGLNAIYSLPGDNRSPSTDDYLITDMFSTPMDEMPDSSGDLLPTQSINDIVYGDLGDIGMQDAANDDGIYVKEAISVETQPQDNLLEPLETTPLVEVVEAENITETFSTDTLDRGFVDGGETLTNIASETSDVANVVQLAVDVKYTELDATESMAADALDVAFVVNETSAQEDADDATHDEEVTNVFEKAIIAEQTDSGLVDKTVTDENMAESLASQIVVEVEPSTSGTPAKKRQRRSVSVNSNSGSQLATETVKLPSKRSTRAKSVTADAAPMPTTPKLRPRRATSQQNLNEIPEGKSPARIKTRRQSSTLSNIAELLKSPPIRRRKASESSEAEILSIQTAKEQHQLPKTPRRSLRSRVSSDAESVTSTPSSRRQSVDRESTSTTPSTRSRRKVITPQPESPIELETEGEKPIKAKATPSKRTRAQRSSGRDDDDVSETSSIASSIRSTRSLRTPITEIDDDNASMKSARSTKRTRPTTTLPPIDENAVTPLKTTTDYLSASRLTRAQKANLEKYSSKQRQPETPTTSTAPKTPRRVSARRQSTMDSIADAEEDITDNSDSKSIASDTSKLSTVSKASRSSKRLRAKK